MENDANPNAGNGDWTAKENITRSFDPAVASFEDLDRRVRRHIEAHQRLDSPSIVEAGGPWSPLLPCDE